MKTAQVFLNEILEKVYIFPLSGAPYDTRIALAQLIGVILAKGMLHKPPENSKVKSYSKDEVNSLVQLNSRDSLTTFHLLINFARQRKTLSLLVRLIRTISLHFIVESQTWYQNDRGVMLISNQSDAKIIGLGSRVIIGLNWP